MAGVSFIESYLRESSQTKLSLVSQASNIQAIADALVAVVRQGGQIYTCGNGGSTCDAMHFVEELVARYLRTRPGIKAAHLCDSSTLTCWANDVGFDDVFERQVETLVGAKDALVVFTTSGNSKNILKALDKANSLGALTIGLLGKGGGAAKSKVKHALVVESKVTSHIQEAHTAIVHILCDLLETTLFPNAK